MSSDTTSAASEASDTAEAATPEAIPGPFRSISTRFSRALIGVITIVLVLFAVTAIVVNLDRAEKQLKASLSTYLSVTDVSLKIPLWNVDYNTARGVLDSLLVDPDVVFAQVEVLTLPAATSAREGYEGRTFSSFVDSPDFETGTRNILYQGESIGTLKIALSREGVGNNALLNAAGILILTGFIIAAIAATSLLISRRYIARPLRTLQASASAIARGDLEVPIEVGRNDEIGALAQSFDSMRQSVKSLFGELQAANAGLEEANRSLERRVAERTAELSMVTERLQLAMQMDEVGIYDADFENDRLWWSPEYIAMMGHDPASFRPVPPNSWIERLHPNEAEKTQRKMETFLAGNDETMRLRQHMLRADRSEIWVDSVMRVQRDETGKATRLTGLAVDVTEQLQREQKLAEANRLIIESLRYASRIQSAMLPAQEAIAAATGDHFLIWEPRDIVGGDFFWHHPMQGGYAIIVGDCTGHGVPGAFMTLIACGMLDRVFQAGVERPSTVLSHMHRDLQTLLGQDQAEGETDDGLEAGICFVSEAERKLVFSGARFSLFHTDDGGIGELKGNKSGIGYRRYPKDSAFSDIVLDLDQDKSFYMATDGIIDQIGGQRRRSFGKKRFLGCLAEAMGEPMPTQARHLRSNFQSFQGGESRRDDVTVLGFTTARH